MRSPEPARRQMWNECRRGKRVWKYDVRDMAVEAGKELMAVQDTGTRKRGHVLAAVKAAIAGGLAAALAARVITELRRRDMGLQQRMMGIWMGRKSPEETRKMMGEMMPMMMDKMGPDGMSGMMGEMMPMMMDKMGSGGMSKMMGQMMPVMMDKMDSGSMSEMMPRMMEMMGPEAFDHMMDDMMPQMMDSCFSWMGPERREFMLGHCRSLLDQMEEKYMRPASA